MTKLEIIIPATEINEEILIEGNIEGCFTPEDGKKFMAEIVDFLEQFNQLSVS